jgi:hypothetical protein
MDMDDANELLQDFIDRRAARIDWKARAERAEAALRTLVGAGICVLGVTTNADYDEGDGYVVPCGWEFVGPLDANTDEVMAGFKQALKQARAVLPQSPEEEA